VLREVENKHRSTKTRRVGTSRSSQLTLKRDASRDRPISRSLADVQAIESSSFRTILGETTQKKVVSRQSRVELYFSSNDSWLIVDSSDLFNPAWIDPRDKATIKQITRKILIVGSCDRSPASRDTPSRSDRHRATRVKGAQAAGSTSVGWCRVASRKSTYST